MIATALALLTLAAPARIQVGADEFNYALSRQTIKAGPAIVQLVNYGEDEHDLRLRRAGGTRVYGLGTVRPGAVGELEARFLPGRFTLWCSLADHRRRGMTATLVVRGT
jgi:plastocyanin